MIRTRTLLGLVAVAVVAGCAPTLPENPPITEARWLDQNWNDHERFWFHHATQGTSTLPVPYDWFMALEQPRIWLTGAPPMLSDPEFLSRFGFIPSPVALAADATTSAAYGYVVDGQGRTYGSEAEYDRAGYAGNPDGLPVGFARTSGVTDPITGQPLPDQIGLTCVACHTGHLEYRGVSLRIDGGPAMIDLGKFRETLGLALAYTRYVPFRFGRFAESVLGPDHDEAAADALSAQLDALLERGERLKAFTDPIDEAGGVEEGFGRLDALNRIGNQVFFKDLRGAEGFDPTVNYVANDAPVNYPHVWSTSWFLWVQYDASIMQPMVRNAGEALGVTARINLVKPGETLYRSTVMLREIHRMEQMLAGEDPFAGEGGPAFKGLRAPAWPEDLLGPIDAARRDRGRDLYEELCRSCHLQAVNDPSGEFWASNAWKRLEPDGPRYLKVPQIPIQLVGTDPSQAEILMERRVKLPASLGLTAFAPAESPGVLCEAESGEPAGELSFGEALAGVVGRVDRAWYDAEGIPPEERAVMDGLRPNCIQAKPIYKARPLDGIWATAPYLHNGAVPTLHDLLLPVAERPARFCLGSREFDPVKVGYETDCLAGTFELDTAIPGNSNAGHELRNGEGEGVIGRGLTPEERLDLIEYLKTL